MRNEKKEERKLFTTRLTDETIKRLEKYVAWRKSQKLIGDSVQEVVEDALVKYLNGKKTD